MNEIDLHGFTHDEAILATEDWLLRESLNYGFEVKVITGNSHKLQQKIIDEVIKKHDFNYYIPSWNTGQIIVN